jgi:Tfp pilus assembly major pilin PilA
MKKFFRSMLGVTLLEIMLVLAIAAMVIVMSIRYYQSASNNQKIATGLNTITGIVAAAESVLSTKGDLSTISADITSYLPGGKVPTSPWGGTITIANGGSSSYTIKMNISSSACAQFVALVTNSKVVPGACPAGATGNLDIVVTE